MSFMNRLLQILKLVPRTEASLSEPCSTQSTLMPQNLLFLPQVNGSVITKIVMDV